MARTHGVSRVASGFRRLAIAALLTLTPALAAAAADSAAPKNAPPRADTVIPAHGLQDDAALLREAFETLHPGLRRYLSPAKLDAAFHVLDVEFTTDRTLGEAYRAFSEFTARIRCGHTWPNFTNQSKDVEHALLQGPRVPFTFRWIDEKMVITHAFTRASQLPPGTEVLSLDGNPARKVLWTLMTIARADGANDGKRMSTLEVTGESRYEAFDVYYPRFFEMRQDSITVLVRRPGAKTREEMQLALLPFEKRDALMAERRHDAPAGTTPIWSHEWNDARTMVLRMPTWATYDSQWDWKADLTKTFDELAERRGTTLIVDLRGNEGGTDEVGRELLARIATAPIRVESLDRKLRYRKVPDGLLPHLTTWDPAFKDWGNSVMEVGDGFYRKIQNTAVDDQVKPAANAFGGDVYVLVGAANSSATFQFAEAAQRSGRAKLVGQTTGGNQNGINGGAFFFLKLPNSGIEIDLPLIGYFPLMPRPDRGIDPDIPVRPSVDAIVRGADAEMEVVGDWMKAKQERAARAAKPSRK